MKHHNNVTIPTRNSTMLPPIQRCIQFLLLFTTLTSALQLNYYNSHPLVSPSLSSTTLSNTINWKYNINNNNNRNRRKHYQRSSSSSSILYGLFDNDNEKVVSEVLLNKIDEAPATTAATTTSGLSKTAKQSLEIEESNEEYSKALTRSLATFIASSLFCFGIYFFYGRQLSEEYFAGYLVEQSLSVDNLLVFSLLFNYFQVPAQYQNKILKWGIIGAIIMRAIMISAGAAIVHSFHAVLLVFAGILIFSSYSAIGSFMNADDEDDEEDLSKNWIVNFSRSLFPTTDRYDGDRFFTIESGKTVVTPMFLCMVAVELSDVVFAVDSIPAVFGITENPLIVFSSNMFAITGLRSLYTILAKLASDLKYLEPSVAVVLGFIGTKMIIEYFGIYVPTTLSLGVVISMLSTGVILSLQEKEQRL